jgi:hypothetical protein
VLGLDEATVQVGAVREQCRATLEGRWIWPTVVLCEAVAIAVNGEEVWITDYGVYYDGAIFIPPAETSGEPVRQASDYMDENDQFLEDNRDADRDALADLILRLRSVDAHATLGSLLAGLKLENYPLLQGKTFRLRVGRERGEHVVELVD